MNKKFINGLDVSNRPDITIRSMVKGLALKNIPITLEYSNEGWNTPFKFGLKQIDYDLYLANIPDGINSEVLEKIMYKALNKGLLR